METAEDVAADILGLFQVTHAAGTHWVPELSCGTSGGQVWVAFRSSDELSSSGDTRYGFWIDVAAANEIYSIEDGESLGRMIWYAEIEVPQPLPEEAQASDDYWFADGIYWSVIG